MTPPTVYLHFLKAFPFSVSCKYFSVLMVVGGSKEPLVLWWSQFKVLNSKFKSRMRHLKQTFSSTRTTFCRKIYLCLCRHVYTHIYTSFILGSIKKSIHQLLKAGFLLHVQKFQSASYRHVRLAKHYPCMSLPDHWLRALLIVWPLGIVFGNLLAKVGSHYSNFMGTIKLIGK